MAEIYETKEERERWIASVVWNPDMSDHFIPEYSSIIEHKLKEKDYEVTVEQQPGTGEKRTYFYISKEQGVRHPEAAKWAWEKALEGIRGIEHNTFESDNGAHHH